MYQIILLTPLLLLYGMSNTLSLPNKLHIYPWTSVCQEAIYCNLVRIDLLRESEEANRENVAELLDEAVKIADNYLTTDLDLRKLKAFIDAFYNNENVISANDAINNGMQYELRRFGVELMNKTSRDEMLKSDINIDQTPLRYIYSEECTERLKICEISIQQISSKLLPNELQICTWQSYPYNWFRCKTMDSWPANLKSVLSIWQNNCELLSECELFDEWESYHKNSKALPADWQIRKSKSQHIEVEDEDLPENRRRFSIFVPNPEIEAQVRKTGKMMSFKNASESGHFVIFDTRRNIDTTTTSRTQHISEELATTDKAKPAYGINEGEVDGITATSSQGGNVSPTPSGKESYAGHTQSQDNTARNDITNVPSWKPGNAAKFIPVMLTIEEEIDQNTDKILQQVGQVNPLQVNYSGWLTCESQSSYFHEFRLYETIHGLAGIEVNCRKHKSVYRHSAGKIVTDKSRTIQKPMLSCNENSLLVGFNFIYLQYATWSYYIHTVQGICQSDTHIEYNLPKILEPPSAEILTKPLRCPDGQALCGIRLNFQKPFLYNYERVYDLQLYCCDIELICRKVRRLSNVEFFEYDNYKKGTQIINFTEPIGYDFEDNRTSFIKPNMVEKTIKKIYPKNVGRRPENWTEPNLVNEMFQPVTYKEHKHEIDEQFVYKLYKQVLLCDNLIYYFSTGFKIVKELSAKHCKPRMVEQYVVNYEYVKNYVDNVTIGIEYETKRGVNLTDFSATISGLEENFRSHNLYIEKKFFAPATRNTRMKLDAIAYFVSQSIGICTSDTEAYHIYTDNLTRVVQPPSYCHHGRDWITLIFEFENEEEPAGIDVSYQLEIGLWWIGKTTRVKYPRGITNSQLELFNFGLGWKSMYTQVHGWNETTRKNYLTGVYKKTYKVKVPFMRKVQVFQVIGKCNQWFFLTGFKYFRMFDFDGVCLGGFSDGPNVFDCNRETIPWLKLHDMM